jgi:cytochrome c
MISGFSAFIHQTLSVVILLAAAGIASAQDAGDARRGGEVYRACVGCHSLRPDIHLTGPSLADMFERRPGMAPGFNRYSDELKKTDVRWDDETLSAWLAAPQALVPGTYMIFRGIRNDQARSDLIAFLKLATVPGGDEAVVAQGLIPQQYADGQMPEPLKSAPPDQQVTAVRHCGDSYFVTTADGKEVPYWEMNLRLKLDTRSTGPEPGKPVIAGGGMMGDRASLVFSSVAELARFVVEKC